MHRPQASALGSGLCTGETLALPFLLQQLIQFPGQGEAGGGAGELVGGDLLSPAGVHLLVHPVIFPFFLSFSFLTSFISIPIQTAHSHLYLDRTSWLSKAGQVSLPP